MSATTKIIVFAHQKGGVGKSTISMNTAHSLSFHKRTAITEVDVQGSIQHMKDSFERLETIPYGKNLRSQDFEYIFIDTPPYLSNTLLETFAQADLVLIPTKVGFLDYMACKSTVELVKIAQKRNPALKAAIFFNMIKPATKLSKSALVGFGGYGLPILDSKIQDRVDLAESVIRPQGIYSMKNETAQKEMNGFVTEVLQFLYK